MFGLRVLAAFFFALLVVTGCQSNLGSDTYSRDDARQAQKVQMGTIVALRPVEIEGTKTPIGSGAGAAIGGIGGSTLGGGRGSLVMAVIGAVAGGLLGAAAEEGLTRARGQRCRACLCATGRKRRDFPRRRPRAHYERERQQPRDYARRLLVALHPPSPINGRGCGGEGSALGKRKKQSVVVGLFGSHFTLGFAQ